MLGIDHCMPIIVGAGIIITILAVAVTYLLAAWQPKKSKPTSKKKK
jgi:fructose-specific phosphotransferase system IIC component